jgi:hypothetical protein
MATTDLQGECPDADREMSMNIERFAPIPRPPAAPPPEPIERPPIPNEEEPVAPFKEPPLPRQKPPIEPPVERPPLSNAHCARPGSILVRFPPGTVKA